MVHSKLKLEEMFVTSLHCRRIIKAEVAGQFAVLLFPGEPFCMSKSE